MTHIETLAGRIEEARKAYYNHTPTMSDAEYDALEEELRALDPQHTLFTVVGAPVATSGAWTKVKHHIPMGSLNKAQVESDMDDWYRGCGLTGSPALVVMDKLDGASIALVYRNRVLVQAITRGDGILGEDITRNVQLMKGAIKMLPPTMPYGSVTPAEVHIRGEIVCLRSDFATHFKGESNPRNTAAGTAKRQSDASKCSFLSIIAYQCLPNGIGMDTKAIELQALQGMGFKVPRWELVTNMADVMTTYQRYIASTRQALDYDIDGLVIEVNRLSLRDALGETNGRPKAAIAFKFPHEAKPTVLRALRWQVGNSGRITPVAEFDSVPLAGANVVQASLHNMSNIADLVEAARPKETTLRVGDKIIVSRRNDVIPYVESVIGGGTTELTVPTNCPSCNGTLTRDGEYLVCRNEDCGAQATGSLKRWVKKIGVLHVGDTLIEALAEGFPFILTETEFEARFGLKPTALATATKDQIDAIQSAVMDIADLYCLDIAAAAALEIGGRRVGGSADKAINNLMAKMTLPLHILVGSIGIPLVGRDGAKAIVDAGYNTLSKMLKAKVADIAAIPGVGDTKARAFVAGFAAKAGLLSKLLAVGIQVQVVSGPLVGMSFCMTGFRDGALSDAIELAGGTMKSSVSKGLTYLIAADPNATTGKAQQAAKYGTKIIGVDDARKLAGI